MATGGQGQFQQPGGAPPEKPFKGLRIALGVIGTLLVLAAIILGILATMKVITDMWSSISIIVLGGLALLIALFTWIWPFPSDHANIPQTPPTPSTPSNIPPTINVTFSTTPASGTAPASTISPLQHALSSIPSSGNTSTALVQTPPPHPSPSLAPASIFQFNMPLKDHTQFYGRNFECNKLITCIKNGGAIAIVDERRAGKTWLLRYIQLAASHHPALGPDFCIGYLSGSNPKCKTMTGFVAEALRELKLTPQSALPLHISTLAHAIKDLSAQHIVPVLCIDEFEGFDNRQEFDLSFAEGLRAMTQDDGLVLIMAARKSLFEIMKDLTGTTSPFFNVVEQLILRPFSLKEAETFVAEKAALADFEIQEKTFLLKNAAVYDANGSRAWPPLRLQLTGQMMLDDRERAKETNEPEHYQIHEKAYQQDFKRRLDQHYESSASN